MNIEQLTAEFNDRVKEDIQGLPLTLVIPKLMSLTAEFMNKALELGKAEQKALIEFLKNQNHDLNMVCIRRRQLLEQYRRMKLFDGRSGRGYDPRQHALAERIIERLEKEGI